MTPEDAVERDEEDRTERLDMTPHECVVHEDMATSPEPNGRIEVTELCWCGRALRTYEDWIT